MTLPWLVVSFLLGIVVHDLWPLSFVPFLSITVGFFLLSLMCRHPIWILLLFLSLGALRAAIGVSDRIPPDETIFPQERQGYELLITGPPHFTREGVTLPARLLDQERVPLRFLVYQGVPLLLSGDVVRVWGKMAPVSGLRNPGFGDPVRQWRRQGVHWDLRVDSAEAVVRVGRAYGTWPFRPIEKLRYQVRERLLNLDQRISLALLRGVLLGDRSSLPDEVRTSFRESGLSHLLAISGQHVGLIAVVFYFLLSAGCHVLPRLNLWLPRPKLVSLLLWIPLFIYVGLAGFPVSAVRAFIFALILIGALIMNRLRDLWVTIACAALFILLLDPQALFEISFQLSFLAVMALALLHDLRTGSWYDRLCFLLLSSLVISIATTPLVAYLFGQITLLAVLANLIAIPLFALLVLPATLMTLMVIYLGLNDSWLFEILQRPSELLIRFAAHVASQGAVLHISLTVVQVLLCYLVLAIGLLIPIKQWKRVTLALMAMSLLVTGQGLYGATHSADAVRLTALDVAQGDALVLSLPDRKTFLIDGGGFYIPRDKRTFSPTDMGERVIVPYLKRQGIRRLAGVVLSHPHPDHFEGLIRVVKEFDVAHFYWNGDYFPDSSFDEFLALIKQKAIPVTKVTRLTTPLSVGGAKITWLHPSSIKKRGDMNDRSIVMRIDYGETCFLLTGDSEAVTERVLIERANLDCDVLKVAHHGSRTSSTFEFIRAVSPEHALISVGRRNPFGHPAPEVLTRYQNLQIPVWRTDLHGAVTVVSDGKEIEVKTVAP